MQTSAQTERKPADNPAGDDYTTFIEALRQTFKASPGPLFKTETVDLWPVYLLHLPQEVQQHHNCNACRHFIQRFGSLVTVDERGRTASALWAFDAPPTFAASVAALRSVVEAAPISGVQISSDIHLGMPVTGIWSHMSVINPIVHRHAVQSAGQAAAEKREDFRIIGEVLGEYSADVARNALALLTSGQLYRADRVEPSARWFLALHEAVAGAGDRRRAIIWRAAATAPAGFAHIRGNVLGTLLDDIKGGKPLEAIRASWAAKLAPTSYQRAQAAPTEGGIAVATRLIAQLGTEASFRRRHASLAEVVPHALWTPKMGPSATSGGMFADVVPRKATPAPVAVDASAAQLITWSKFQERVLPDARKLEIVEVPGSRAALVTATDPSAPAVLQWSNSFSWYYGSGIDAEIRRRLDKAGGQYEGTAIRGSLIWNCRNDLDLHCTTPSGHVIYFGAKQQQNGWLDVDMNVQGETTEPVENIRWLRGEAPRGVYQFRVNNYRWHERPTVPTPFRFELEVEGQTFTMDGQIIEEGIHNARATVNVANFNYTPGCVLAHPPSGMVVASGAGSTGWKNVSAVVPSPNQWGGAPSIHGRHVFFLTGDAPEATGARGLMVEMLLPEYRPIRQTLEAYIGQQPVGDAPGIPATGIGMSDARPWNLRVRVTSTLGVAEYMIDRWD